MRSFAWARKVVLPLFVCSLSLAEVPAPVLNLIEKSYNPTITAQEIDESMVLEICNKTKVIITGQDPVTGLARPVNVVLYTRKLTRDSGDLKTVILMPPTGGETVLDRNYARLFCASGLRVALVQSWEGDTFTELDLNMHDRGALRALAAIRHTIEYLKPRRANQIGIFGTSVGGISSALALGFEPRISAGVLIVAGAGMADIISASTEKTLTRLREERKEAFEFASQEDYRKALAEHLQIEPLDFIGHSGKKSVLMMVADADITVPTKTQYDLYRSFGEQEIMTHNSNHLNTILFTAATKGVEFVRYFKSKLN